MSIDDVAGEPRGPESELAARPLVERAPRADRLIAPADPEGRDLPEHLQERIAELDAIAWNLPSPPRDLFGPLASPWPRDEH